MTDRHDLELVLRSHTAIVVVETTEESRGLELLRGIAVAQPSQAYRPLFRWSVTDGLQRLDIAVEPQRHNADPAEVLRHIRAVAKPGIYVLLDLHPFLTDPVIVRLLKDIAIAASERRVSLVLISHALTLPRELVSYSAKFELRLPDEGERADILRRVVAEHDAADPARKARVDAKAFGLLVRNLSGLTHADTERLARRAVFADSAITADDLPTVMQAKYRLLNRDGALRYEHDTSSFAAMAGFTGLKRWLQQRRAAFAPNRPANLDAPKGILLLGVQGCGKSLAAKAAAGALGLPLLRLDAGALYNKFHGETERNVREALRNADTMSPCVLWIDEIEKGFATGHDHDGTSGRVLGTLLTWMAERRSEVLLVATANDVRQLPPELLRKGRFDEIFFVDLPTAAERADVLRIHLEQRGVELPTASLAALVAATEGCSGAEIEQGVVAALYAAHAGAEPLAAAHLLAEYQRTKPLSVLMAEHVAALRQWARERTVPSS
jgi:predicted AAA+ superfamily ATPase